MIKKTIVMFFMFIFLGVAVCHAGDEREAYAKAIKDVFNEMNEKQLRLYIDDFDTVIYAATTQNVRDLCVRIEAGEVSYVTLGLFRLFVVERNPEFDEPVCEALKSSFEKYPVVFMSAQENVVDIILNLKIENIDSDINYIVGKTAGKMFNHSIEKKGMSYDEKISILVKFKGVINGTPNNGRKRSSLIRDEMLITIDNAVYLIDCWENFAKSKNPLRNPFNLTILTCAVGLENYSMIAGGEWPVAAVMDVSLILFFMTANNDGYQRWLMDIPVIISLAYPVYQIFNGVYIGDSHRTALGVVELLYVPIVLMYSFVTMIGDPKPCGVGMAVIKPEIGVDYTGIRADVRF